jgi:predicted PurR-regulated permease PerM
MPTTERAKKIFLISLIAAACALSFFVLRPYLLTLALSLIIAIVIDPAYLFIRNAVRGRKRIAAVITIILLLFVIIIPLGFFGYLVFLEAQGLYASATGPNAPSFIENTVSSNETLRDAWAAAVQQLDSLVRNSVNFFLSHAAGVFASVASFLLNLFLFFLSVFYILTSREQLRDMIKKISPLENEYDDRIIGKIRSACNSVVRGSLLVALAQGIVAAIGFSIFGVPAPMLWGGVAAIASFLPTVGTTLVTGPAALYLFLTGNTGDGIGMLIWAVVAVGLLDNVLAPILIDRGIKLHPLIILLAVLGGLALFGPAGFVLGPVIIAFLVALVDTYIAFSKKEKESSLASS